MRLVSNYVDLLNDAANDLDVPEWLNSVRIQYADSEFVIVKTDGVNRKVTVTQSLALCLFHLDSSVVDTIKKMAMSIELFPRAVSMACSVGPPAISTLSLTPLYTEISGQRKRDTPSVRVVRTKQFDTYKSRVY